MTTKSRVLVLMGTIGIALTACAAQPAKLAALPGTEGCFWTSTVFDWVALDSSTLIVSAPTSNSPYLVKLMSPVPGLAARERMVFHSGVPGGGQFCSANHSFVTVAGRYGWRQHAVAVRRLTPEVARQLTADMRSPIVNHAPTPYPAQSAAPSVTHTQPTG